eukprot:6205218-Pleurochrysis_carterae.AAC.2
MVFDAALLHGVCQHGSLLRTTCLCAMVIADAALTSVASGATSDLAHVLSGNTGSAISAAIDISMALRYSHEHRQRTTILSREYQVARGGGAILGIASLLKQGLQCNQKSERNKICENKQLSAVGPVRRCASMIKPSYCLSSSS